MSHINLDLQASHKMLMLLDEANASMESVIDQIPGIFIVINENHEILRANLGFSRLFGLDAEDIFRAPLSGFFGRENWKIFAHYIQKVIDAEPSAPQARFEMCLAAGNDGEKSMRSYHWTLARQNARSGAEGCLLSIFGADITGMREAERRLMKLFSSIPLGIFTLDKDGKLGESYSRHLEAMLDCAQLAGADVEEVLFNPQITDMDDQDISGVKTLLGCLGRSDLEYPALARNFPQEIFHNKKADRKDGRWLKITYQPIVFEHVVEQFLIILEDRTAIVNAEKEMLESTLERERVAALEKQSLAMYEDAIRDPLTGLYTRLYMKDAVAAVLWGHDRHKTSDVSMAIFDIDHFKKINDTHGHGNGDLVLAGIARIILRQSRETDIPIRFGGEEFVVFIVDDCSAALALAERVRREVEAMQFDVGGTVIRTTISGGVASHRKGESLEDFMQRADKLLYKAKNQGRNRNIGERKI